MQIVLSIQCCECSYPWENADLCSITALKKCPSLSSQPLPINPKLSVRLGYFTHTSIPTHNLGFCFNEASSTLVHDFTTIVMFSIG